MSHRCAATCLSVVLLVMADDTQEHRHEVRTEHPSLIPPRWLAIALARTKRWPNREDPGPYIAGALVTLLMPPGAV
jgi:hypothetical protein